MHKIYAVPSHNCAYACGKKINDDFYDIVELWWQKTIQDGDIDVFVCPTRSDCARYGNPQHQHAQQLVSPDKPESKKIPGYNLAGSQQDHATEEDDKNGIFHRAAHLLKPLQDG